MRLQVAFPSCWDGVHNWLEGRYVLYSFASLLKEACLNAFDRTSTMQAFYDICHKSDRLAEK